MSEANVNEVQETQFCSRDLILGTKDIIVEKVPLPEPYNGHVYIKGMTGEEWDVYQESIVVEDPDSGKRKVDLKESKAKMLVQCLCDEQGNLLMTMADVPSLMKKSNRLLETLVKVAQRLNGMGDNSPGKK